LTNFAKDAVRRHPVVWNSVLPGYVTRDIASVSDKVFAASKIWSDTGVEEVEWGPCDWMPRPAPDGLPQRGDPCRISFDLNRNPFISWWESASG
jgi:hypothetical protein